MRASDSTLVTPVYLKLEDDFRWPKEESSFYLLSSDGLFLCRNHPFFRSCVRVEGGPRELAPHREALTLNYPKIRRPLIEKTVGFFDRIAKLHGAEAALLLAWDKKEECVRLVVPEQRATVYRNWAGKISPIGVHYEIPPLDDYTYFGDIHSHVNMPAYASGVDRHDEIHSPGLHIVVGRLDCDPPEFHAEAVVDGKRFTIDARHVIDGYGKRELDVPPAWIESVRVEEERPTYWSDSSSSSWEDESGWNKGESGWSERTDET